MHFRCRADRSLRIGIRLRPLANAGGEEVGGSGHAGDRAGADDWAVGWARDLGVGGAFIATPRSLPVGTWLEVDVDLPDPEGAIAVRAEVRWVAKPEHLPPDHDAGFGVAFEPLDTEALLAMSEYLAEPAGEKTSP